MDSSSCSFLAANAPYADLALFCRYTAAATEAGFRLGQTESTVQFPRISQRNLNPAHDLLYSCLKHVAE